MGLITTLGLKPLRRVPTAVGAGPGDKPPLSAVGDTVNTGGGKSPPPTTAPPTGSAPPTPPTGTAPPTPPSTTNAGAPPAVDKNQAAYNTARAGVQTLIDGLNAHPQKARIATEIGNAQAKLGEADTLAGAKDWAKAGKKLAEAKAICVAAKKLADDWANYVKQRTDALALAMSFVSDDNQGMTNWAQPHINAADAFVAASPPNFPAALKKLKTVRDGIKPHVKSLIDNVKGKLKTLEKSDKKVKEFAQAEMDSGKALLAQADKAFADEQWSQARQHSLAALRVMGPAMRMAERRGRYDTQRKKTVGDIAKVRAAASVKDRADKLDKIVEQADGLAAHEVRKFEEAVRVLEGASTQAATWTGLAKTVGSYTKDVATADADLAALDKHAAAAKITGGRDACRAILTNAKNIASTADAAADPVQAWNAALTEVTRARTDLAAAKKLADSFGAAGAAEAAAANPGDTKALKAALDKLRADGKAAEKAPGADQATAEFKRFNDAVIAAKTALDTSDGATAAAKMKEASTALVEAKTLQAGHGQYTSTLPGVEAQLKALKKSPRLALIQARIDPVDAALAEAKAKDQAHAAADAMAALRRASDALAIAKKTDADRAKFDSDADVLAKLIAKVKDATEKGALETMLADAKKVADAFTFPEAKKALDKVEVRLDKGKLEAMMKAKPTDPNIAKLASKMTDKGGGATVDAMIQAIPDGGDARLVNALAQGRYNMKFATGKSLPDGGGDPVKAMKAICGMFQNMPQDIRNNPSIRGVTHSDAVGSAGGGHNFDTAAVTMSGRPNAIQQQFGAAQVNFDPKTGTNVPELPAAIDADAQPANTTAVDYLGFAAAHEVGHGVDDSAGFMAMNGHLEKYGGWVTFGSSVQPLADKIGADARFSNFYKTAEQKQYILDKLLNKPSNAPAVTAGSPEDIAKQAFDNWYLMATATDVYRRQGDCDAIKIGDYVYHEAYARTWVGYLAAARKKALTGYQFRAPGEWFAELYAGYRSGKLKPEHPAMDWLKKL